MIKISINDYKITAGDIEGKRVSELSDKPSADGLSADELKSRFDALSDLLIQRLNSLIEALQALSGATEIGAKVDGIDGATVAQVLKNAVLLAGAAKTTAEGKQDMLTFDTAPMIGSSNPVTSGGVYQALQDMSISGGIVLDSVIQNSPNPVKNSAIYSEFQNTKSLIGDKVDKVSGKGLSSNDYTTAEKNKLAKMARETRNITVLASSWSEVGSSYQALVSVSGILAGDMPHIGLSYQGDNDTYLNELKEYAKVSYAKAADGEILFTALEEKPLEDLHLQLEVVR